jgi:hypothetical protein
MTKEGGKISEKFRNFLNKNKINEPGFNPVSSYLIQFRLHN